MRKANESPYCDTPKSSKTRRHDKYFRNKNACTPVNSRCYSSIVGVRKISKSFENISKLLTNHEKMFSESKESLDLPPKLTNFTELSSKACQSLLKSKEPLKVVKKVSSHNFCLLNHHVVSKRSVIAQIRNNF